MYEGNQIGTLDLCSLYENCIQVMIMSEKLYQNPIPEWNAAWFIRGKNPMYTHVKKSSELSFSPVYNETTVTNGFMDRTYIEKIS